MSLQSEIDVAVKKLYRFGDTVAKNRQRIASLGGSYFAAAAEAAAPRSKRPHRRYNTSKVTKSIRAPKGSGNVVATYLPGNLAASFKVLKFRRAASKVYVGARLAKGQASGIFGPGRRQDGYYMHMVEMGTRQSAARPFFRSAWQRAEPRVLSIMLEQWRRVGAQFEQQNKI